jgi:hypothetical protein
MPFLVMSADPRWSCRRLLDRTGVFSAVRVERDLVFPMAAWLVKAFLSAGTERTHAPGTEEWRAVADRT